MNSSRWMWPIALVLVAVVVALWMARVRGEDSVESLWEDLASPSGPPGGRFDSSMVAGLPAPARRYLMRAIAPGTPLSSSVRLRMHGSMRLQPEGEFLNMEADQILAPPRGLVWKARVQRGLMRIQGFDSFGGGRGKLRWWLYGLVPVATADGPDVDRSAAGRVAGEAIFVPAVLLPQFGTRWEAVDDSTAAFEMTGGDEPVRVVITVDAAGRLERVRIRRWHDHTGNGTPGYDAFDVDQFSKERSFGGYTIPTLFRAGWRLGGPEAFPFFYAEIDEAEYH